MIRGMGSPPLPRIRGHHYTLSRPPGAQREYVHQTVIHKGDPVKVWQWRGWQFTWWVCPAILHGQGC
jgi:hypothetical protein